MSSIGSGPLGIPPIVSSAAGAAGQQKPAEANRTQQDGNIQRFELERADQFEKTVGDIGQSDGADDRDADGRMPWSFQRPNRNPGASGSSEPGQAPHPPDPSGDRGSRLDLDA
jgi:hypothetical protein